MLVVVEVGLEEVVVVLVEEVGCVVDVVVGLDVDVELEVELTGLVVGGAGPVADKWLISSSCSPIKAVLPNLKWSSCKDHSFVPTFSKFVKAPSPKNGYDSPIFS